MEAPSFIGGVKGQLIVLLCGRAQWRGWEQTLTHTHTHSHSKPDACHHMELFKNGHSPSQKSNINSLSQWLLRQHWIIAQGEQWHTHTHTHTHTFYDLITNYWKLWIFSISDRIERELKGLFSKRFALGPRYYINNQVATQHNIKIVYCIKEKQNKMCVFYITRLTN